MRGFLEANPIYKGRDLYVTGESYAGHFIPHFAHKLAAQQYPGLPLEVNLRGIAIGNGLTDAYAQYPSYARYSLERDLVSPSEDAKLMAAFPVCEDLITESRDAGFLQGLTEAEQALTKIEA